MASEWDWVEELDEWDREAAKDARYRAARLDADDVLAELCGYTMGSYRVLGQVLGYGDTDAREWTKVFTEEDYQTCKQLAGPYGRVIFKMLCHKYGLTELQQSCADGS